MKLIDTWNFTSMNDCRELCNEFGMKYESFDDWIKENPLEYQTLLERASHFTLDTQFAELYPNKIELSSTLMKMVKK